ncbi:hypothetical protein SADUNF_Sadunf14G0063600 [Salix dunnii]|uniref:Uncharacterized protein n=1 Tax=Salix dunnii TaxID=1413687 RepID=A0A835JGP7_9ROSI|nr:hypothetical protein SADUNF_Sadunf14G0063600 [Salix dunnii]
MDYNVETCSKAAGSWMRAITEEEVLSKGPAAILQAITHKRVHVEATWQSKSPMELVQMQKLHLPC